MGIKPVDGIPNGVVETFELLCLKAAPALTALVVEREKARALVAEWRADAATHLNPNRRAHYKDCADRLAAILEGK